MPKTKLITLTVEQAYEVMEAFEWAIDEYEKEQVCEIVAEAISRAYGTDRLNDLDFDVTGTLLEEEINA